MLQPHIRQIVAKTLSGLLAHKAEKIFLRELKMPADRGRAKPAVRMVFKDVVRHRLAQLQVPALLFVFHLTAKPLRIGAQLHKQLFQRFDLRIPGIALTDLAFHLRIPRGKENRILDAVINPANPLFLQLPLRQTAPMDLLDDCLGGRKIAGQQRLVQALNILHFA